jgi:hypothetical protein
MRRLLDRGVLCLCSEGSSSSTEMGELQRAPASSCEREDMYTHRQAGRQAGVKGTYSKKWGKMIGPGGEVQGGTSTTPREKSPLKEVFFCSRSLSI